ncbi:MAG TPA: polysaccharide deacetylase family protein [Polyangiaceae bacterium]|nr:polysaccharide deacetylase family protein [Polyangiaceae bacterium]
MRLCSVSVDLDEIPNYFAIHGLPTPAGPEAHAVYDLALGRLLDLATAHRIPLTLFAVGADLVQPSSAAALRKLIDAGHEVGNHTLDHRYDLTRLSRAEQLHQIADGAAAIRAAVGEAPTGFRAPGYTITDQLYGVLQEAGVAYSSSVFPCPPYYLAKALAMVLIRLRRRTSHSILDVPQVLLAPRQPYRVGTPYWKRGAGMVEMPMQVTRWLRLPYIGTTLTLFGPTKTRWLTQGVTHSPFVNLELHGIDVLAAQDGLNALVPHQPDVRVTLQSKLDSLSEAISGLKKAGYSFVRLDEAARSSATPLESKNLRARS